MTNLDAEEPLTLAALMPAPTRHRPKRPWKAIGIAAAVVAVTAGVGVLAWTVRPGDVSARTIGPPKAAAARECRSAVESEAQRRADAARATGSSTVTSTVSGVDVAEPVWKSPAWTVDATLRFTIVSIFGQTPVTVFVRCTATTAGGKVSTSIATR